MKLKKNRIIVINKQSVFDMFNKSLKDIYGFMSQIS